MRPITTVIALLGATAVTISPPVATADPSVLDTIAQWEAQGYTVNIDRIGSAPLDRCVITGVRNPQRVTRWVSADDDGWGRSHRGSGVVEVVVSQSVSISLDCTR